MTGSISPPVSRAQPLVFVHSARPAAESILLLLYGGASGPVISDAVMTAGFHAEPKPERRKLRISALICWLITFHATK